MTNNQNRQEAIDGLKSLKIEFERAAAEAIAAKSFRPRRYSKSTTAKFFNDCAELAQEVINVIPIASDMSELTLPLYRLTEAFQFTAFKAEAHLKKRFSFYKYHDQKDLKQANDFSEKLPPVISLVAKAFKP